MKFYRALLPIIPSAFLALCIYLGGSSNSDQAEHRWLQLISLGVIALMIYPSSSPLRVRPASQIACVILLLSLWPLVQLVPVPAQIWQALAQRDVIAAGYSALGMDVLPSLPISLAPEKTITSLMALLPPFAFMLLIAAIGRKTGPEPIVWGILACGMTSAAFGLFEAMDGPALVSRWGGEGQSGQQAGFFANANHQVTLLLMCLPLLAGISGQRSPYDRSHQVIIFRQCLLAVILLLLLSAIWAAGVRAGYVLVLPVGIMSLLIGRNSSSHRIKAGSLATILASAAVSIILITSAPALKGVAFADLSVGDYGREIIIWPRAIEMLKDNWFAGSGLGTFASVFPLYEDPATVTPVWINQAHNEYLQIVIELGLPGLLAICSGLGLWLWYAIKAWTGSDDPASPIRRAASVSCMVVLLHSLVDYPARTPAILVILVACALLTAWPRGLAPLAKRRRPSDAKQDVRWLDL